MSEAKLEPLRPLYHLTSNQIFNYVPSPKYAPVSQFCVAQVETRNTRKQNYSLSYMCIYIDIISNHTILTIM